MGWRVCEGDLPYRDFYLFLPPYYVFLTAGLYRLFGNHMFAYSVFGLLFFRMCAWALTYKILTRKAQPHVAMISAFTGLCVTSTYLMDQPYDYNPLIYTLSILAAFLCMKLYETNTIRKEAFFSGCNGFISGVLLMMKQTTGIAIPALCLILTVIRGKRQGNQNLRRLLLSWFAGFLTAIAPGVFYLSANGLWIDFFRCIFAATEAKVGSRSMIALTFGNFLSLKPLCFTAALICCYALCKTFWRMGAALLGAAFILPEAAKVLNAFVRRAGGLAAALCVIAAAGAGLFALDYRILKKRGTPSPCVRALIALLALSTLFSALLTPKNYDGFYNIGVNVRNLERFFLFVALYLDIAVWAFLAFRLWARKEKTDIPFFVALTLLLTFHGISFISATLEELYALTLVGVLIAFLMRRREESFFLQYQKNAFMIAVCTVICFVCLSQKILIPYEWHGWRTPTIYDGQNQMTSVDIEGLEGFSLPQSDAESYARIVSLIEKYSKPDDIVYQFPNILLFHVLTERKIGYWVIPYFDVMPDTLAERNAAELWKNPPSMVIWAELSEERWELHEKVFRNGNPSGQRELQRWHDAYMLSHYQLLETFDNHERQGESIGLYVRSASGGGTDDNSPMIRP